MFLPICCQANDYCCEGPGNDACISDDAECENTCPDGSSCTLAEYCQLDHLTNVYSCVPDCQSEAECGDSVCCPIGTRCAGGSCALPDLVIDEAYLAASVDVTHRSFAAGACEFDEGCIVATGDRRLMRFDLRTPNIGEGDLFLGNPTASDLFMYSDCHDHHHFLGYANYELRDLNGQIAATGHKQAFCLLDLDPDSPNAGMAQYSCNFQGISAGWSDIYSSDLPCQWVDITGVPAGDYMLAVQVNFDQILAESDYTNNTVEVPVTVTGESCTGCGQADVACCQPGNPCNWEANDLCDCQGFYEWDAVECGACDHCHENTTCPGGCTATDMCCDPANPCMLGTDGVCACGGQQAWDAADCMHCVSADTDCAPADSCPGGCTPDAGVCCDVTDTCGFAGDGVCDCGGAAWDFMDCSSCACN